MSALRRAATVELSIRHEAGEPTGDCVQCGTPGTGYTPHGRPACATWPDCRDTANEARAVEVITFALLGSNDEGLGHDDEGYLRKGEIRRLIAEEAVPALVHRQMLTTPPRAPWPPPPFEVGEVFVGGAWFGPVVGDVVPGHIARRLPVGSVVLWTGAATKAPESDSARRHTDTGWEPPIGDADQYRIVHIEPPAVTE